VEQQSPRGWSATKFLHRGTECAVALLLLFFFLATAAIVLGQQDDPSEVFLKAYLSAQQAEKLEHESRFKTALAKYRFAGSLIETLRRSHRDWQPAVVEYRARKIGEGILRIQQSMTKQNALSASATALPEVVPALPESEGWSEPGSEVVSPPSTETTAQTSRDSGVSKTTKKLRDKVDGLQTALGKARTDLENAQKEKENVDARLKQTSSKLAKAENDLKKSNKSENDARDQFAKAQESLRALNASQESSAKEQEQLRTEIAQLKKALATADGARLTAEKQRDDIQAKFVAATEHVSSLERQRDEASVQVKTAKEIEQGFHVLLADKDHLQRKLDAAEKTVRTLSDKDPTKAQKFAEMNQQMAELQQQLVESEKRNDYLTARAAELGVQLDEAGTELQAAKLAGANSEESGQLARENELLRNIIVRERQEEVRRAEARKLVLAQLDNLKIRSAALTRQIQFLAQPVTTLSTAELALLRQPVVSVSDQQAGLFRANFVFEKTSDTNSISVATADPNARSDTSRDGNTRSDAGITDVPPKLQALVRAAKKNLGQGNYQAAEKQYQQILNGDPNNVDALSNLGVIYYRSGKLPSAEAVLRRAVASGSENDFLLTTLGVIHYRQSKFDDAITELRKAIEINPKNATAHNYLGIAASQKGRQQEAETEILQALANNPNDADAHFNLAVILATTQPGSKELAREHYARATALGTQRSPSLEKLLQ
jgi:tetratricopeptide (TPR) repeat protein/predicted  nucleic acid-binding Zn-ribbon protein